MVLTLERTSRMANLCHALLTIVGSGAITLSIIGVSVPMLHRDKADIWHIMKNWGAIGLIGGSGLTLVWVSRQLEILSPEIRAIEKAQGMQAKHNIASWLYQANKLSSDIAQSVVVESSPLQQQQQQQQLEAAYQAGLQEGYEEGVNVVSNGNPPVTAEPEPSNLAEISNLSPEVIEMVKTEILDGKSESKIIKETLGMVGRNYAKGKAIVNQIKRFIQPEQD